MQKNSLGFGIRLAYAFGMMGWSMMINLISVILVYLYLPPANSGLPFLISQVTIFGILNAIAIITSSGRLVDAVYDPFIAQVSDRSKNPKGRRIPIMKRAILPSLLFCCLVFSPLKQSECTLNVVWLALTLVGFYVSTTTFIIPYNALLPELATTAEEKVKLASWQSAGYVFGIGMASLAFNISPMLHQHFHISRFAAMQYTVFILAALASLCMTITVLAIDEKKYSNAIPSSINLRTALRHTLVNKNFLLFIVADFSYFMGITIITSGLIYFITILLQLPETVASRLTITMAVVSFIFYPVVNLFARKIGKKPIVIFSLCLLALVFSGIYFLGRPAIDHEVQIYTLVIIAAVPFAALNILPNAILAEVIDEDKRITGENKEAIYFAVRYFFVKIAQTFGIAIFAMFLIHGKDIGHDFGIRLNGILGFILCATAALIFTRFKELK